MGSVTKYEYLKATATVGWARATEFKKAVKRFCFRHDLTLELDETKDFLETLFLIKATGADAQLLAFKSWLERIEG